MKKPVLTIGIIFKNEIKVLERCMKALQPLRDAVPCQLVMADTGSDDGSRAVAEQYADVLFDFPWVDDFSAARNAVMERAAGEWFLTVDADEYLDGDISELTAFLTGKESRAWSIAAVNIRNYYFEDGERADAYGDFLALRMVRMSTGARYSGAIHESWPTVRAEEVYPLSHTTLHHSGYVGLGGARGEAKRVRNLKLLRKELEQHPHDLRVICQCVESAQGIEELKYIRMGLQGLDEKWENWRSHGSVLLCHAVKYASGAGMEELDAWAARAVEEFPDSPYAALDVSYVMLNRRFQEGRLDESVEWGARYLAGLERHEAGEDSVYGLFGVVSHASAESVRTVRTVLASAASQTERYALAIEQLDAVDCAALSAAQTENWLGALLNCHTQSETEMTERLSAAWDALTQPTPDFKTAAARLQRVKKLAETVFAPQWREMAVRAGHIRRAWTVFLGLGERCEMGLAARVLAAEEPEEMRAALARVEDWGAFPIFALIHALEWGVPFPLPENPLMTEEMDALAARLVKHAERYSPVLDAGLADSMQAVCWERALTFTLISAEDWTEDGADLALLERFAAVEEKYLPLCCGERALTEEGLFLLPFAHRFGWWYLRARQAKEQGDTAGYVRCLRKGLESAPGVKSLVERLLDEVKREQSAPPAELLALAEQVRLMLARFDPDDPAVAALKASPVYQRVAHLVES